MDLIWALFVSTAIAGCGSVPTDVEQGGFIARTMVEGDSASIGGEDSTSTGDEDGPSFVTAPPVVLNVGESIILQAKSKGKGRSLSSNDTKWRAVDASVVAASTTGKVTGLADGATLVLQTTGSVTDTLPFIVGTGPAALRFASDSLVLKVGASATATVTDLRYPVNYLSLSPTVATVGGSGSVSAKAVGRTTVRATNMLGATGDLTLIVTDTTSVAPPPVVPPAGTPTTPPPSGRTIDMTLTRWTAGTGSVLVSSGVPLPAGALRPSDLGLVRVFVGGVEQRVYLEALKGQHTDGSLRTVLVQFPLTMSSGVPLSGQIVIGSTRALADIAKPAASRSLPDASILPSNPTYLVTTDLVGPTITKAEAGMIDPLFTKYDNDFALFAEQHWVQYADAWEQNYYDRAQAYLAQWVRTGNPTYWYRGLRQARTYRISYLEDAQYGTSPHWSQMDGVAMHYQLTGDEASRYAVGRVAETLRYFRDRAAVVNHPDVEGRVLARTLMAMLWGWRLEARGNEEVVTSSQLATMISNVLGKQSADGSYRFTNICAPDPGNLAYMDGMIDEALIQAYTHFQNDARIIASVKKSSDFLWSQWDTARQGVKYAPYCPAADHNVGTSELNNLMVNGFAWTYAKSGDVTYRVRADSLFRSEIRNQYLQGSKQFNQHYSVSFRYLAWRAAR